MPISWIPSPLKGEGILYERWERWRKTFLIQLWCGHIDYNNIFIPDNRKLMLLNHVNITSLTFFCRRMSRDIALLAFLLIVTETSYPNFSYEVRIWNVWIQWCRKSCFPLPSSNVFPISHVWRHERFLTLTNNDIWQSKSKLCVAFLKQV